MSFLFNRLLASPGIMLYCLGLLAPLLPGAQGIQPGFDPAEYADLLQLNFVAMSDSLKPGDEYTMKRGVYKKILRSPEVGLFNRVEMYLQNGNTAVISLRGTVGKAESWMENFYFAMSKASGRLRLNDSTLFEYRLAADTQAFVHTGWLLGLAHLAPFINVQLKSLLDSGITNVIVMGHSQGGALAYLTTSYIWYKYASGYPKLKIKTYASAAPKPGNLYYAYDFDHITGVGYGYRIVNSADWVPETPVSIQTVNDFNEVNPVTDATKFFRKQKFFVRVALMHGYNRLDRASYKSMKKYRRFMGGFMYKRVKNTLPQLEQPDYPYSMNYMTAGSPVILVGDSKYQEQFKFDGKDLFIHHMLKPYMYLLNQQFPLE